MRRRKITGKIFVYTDKHDMNHYFWFDNAWLEMWIFGGLCKPSKALLPVLLSFDRGKWHNPGQLYLASLAGMAPQTVSEGFKGLGGFPGLEIERYRTKKGHNGRRFRFTVENNDHTGKFPFHK